MNTNSLLLGLGLAVTASAFAQGADDGVSGVWSLVEINDKPLPVEAWEYNQENAACDNLTNAGTLLMDTAGRWAGLTVVSTSCPGAEGEEPSISQESSIFMGSYSVADEMISFHDETLDSIDHGYIAGGRLELTVEGIGNFEGQTAEFVFQKAQ
jgi:hypothetical protein